MRTFITDSVVLPADAERLFAMYLDPVVHAGFTGHPVTIGSQAGAKFKAFGGQLSGEVLRVVTPQLIVQSWRSTNFSADDPDSTLILMFCADVTGGRIELTHLDVPDHELQDVSDGWRRHYWEPWREFLSANRA
ncbi:MAG: SRPBCC domain-containing protein [Planctomycetota bacterium]